MTTRSIPWPRIFAEGVAIVVSIVLAFGIQAWWEDRQEREEEQRVLLALASDFEVTRDNIVETVAAFEEFADTITRVLDVISGSSETVPLSEMNDLVAGSFSWQTFEPRLSTYEDIVGSGSLRLIRDDSLRTAMALFVADFEDARKVVDAFGTRWMTVEEPYLAQHFVMSELWEGYGRPIQPLPFRADPDALHNREFANILIGRRLLIRDLMRNTDAVLGELDVILRLIRRSLDA